MTISRLLLGHIFFTVCYVSESWFSYIWCSAAESGVRHREDSARRGEVDREDRGPGSIYCRPVQEVRGRSARQGAKTEYRQWNGQ